MSVTGGQYAIKGFVYQTIAGVLHALLESPWEYVTVEPITGKEKVDVLWEDGTGSKKCQQIKTSINNFGRADVIRWLTEMVTDIPDSQQYELILIGNRTDAVGEFIKELNNRTATCLPDPLNSVADRIGVEVLVDNSEVLQGHLQNEVYRFFSKHNIHPSHDTLVVITGGLCYQFFQFALVGAQASKAEWTETMLKWATNNYPKGLHMQGRKDRLSVGIYQADQRKLVKSYLPTRLVVNVENWSNLTEADEHFRNATAIHIPPRPNKPESKPVSDIPLLAIPEYTSLFTLTPVVIEEWEKTWLTEMIKKYLFQSPPADFFYVGSLQQKFNLPGPFLSGLRYEGTHDEEAKYQAIQGLRWTFQALEELKNTIDFVNQLYYLPLVLENAGGSYDEEVKVMLKIPDTVRVITTNQFHVPDNIDALKMLTYENPLTRLLAHAGDSYVTRFPIDPILEPRSNLGGSTMFLFSSSRELEIRRENFVDSLGDLFNREVFDDLPGFLQIQYTFSQINPNMRVAFPAYLLFTATQSFTIEYQIRSKNTTAIQSGQLECKILQEGDSIS